MNIEDRYEYNQKDLLNWNSETGIFTFKGHMKASPNEIVITLWTGIIVPRTFIILSTFS